MGHFRQNGADREQFLLYVCPCSSLMKLLGLGFTREVRGTWTLLGPMITQVRYLLTDPAAFGRGRIAIARASSSPWKFELALNMAFYSFAEFLPQC